MSIMLAVLLTPVELPPSARRDDIVVHEAGDLVAACREETEAYYVGKGQRTYQWTATHKSRGNVLHVEGRLRVGGEDVQVHCKLPRGSRLTYMTLEVDKP